jgi:hypothetical protein
MDIKFKKNEEITLHKSSVELLENLWQLRVFMGVNTLKIN